MDVTTAAPKTRRHWLAPVALGAVIAALVGAAFLFGHTDAAVPASNVADAGPMHAHFEMVNGTRLTICDNATATVSNDGRAGVAGQVDIQGPATVIVTVAGNGRLRRGRQQVTLNDDTVTFDFPLTAPADSVTIKAETAGSTGSCQLIPPTYMGQRGTFNSMGGAR